jgi:hypothetical protein
VVYDSNITVVSEPFTAELLSEECHGHFAKDLLGEHVCEEEHVTNKKRTPTNAQSMFFLYKILLILL